MKIDPTGKVSRMFMSIPGQLSRNTRRYVTSSVVGKQNDNITIEQIKTLEDSKTVNVVYHVDDPNVGMGLTKNEETFKLFVGDTGLFVTLAFGDKAYTENIIYEKLLADKLPTNMGYIYENLVAQMLTAGGNELYYHTWSRDDKHYYEIDFLLSRGFKLCPVEVKSSNNRSHTSLNVFCQKYSNRVSNRYLACTKDLLKDSETLIIPIYMTWLL